MKMIRITCSMLLAATLFAVSATAKTTPSATTAPANAWKPIVMKPFANVTKSYVFNFAYSPYNPSLKISLVFDNAMTSVIDGSIQTNTPGVYMLQETQRTITPNSANGLSYVNFLFKGTINVYGNVTTYTIEGIWYRDATGAENWYLMRNTI